MLVKFHCFKIKRHRPRALDPLGTRLPIDGLQHHRLGLGKIHRTRTRTPNRRSSNIRVAQIACDTIRIQIRTQIQDTYGIVQQSVQRSTTRQKPRPARIDYRSCLIVTRTPGLIESAFDFVVIFLRSVKFPMRASTSDLVDGAMEFRR